jgi:Protein of unknown function (DUF4065)
MNATSSTNFEKLKACIVYACAKEQPVTAQLDHIKLNKVLWYSDAAAYAKTGVSITKGKYVRKKHGPVAKYMKSATDNLIRDGILTAGKHFDAARGAWVDVYNVTGSLDDVYEETGDDAVRLSDSDKNYLDHAFRGACLANDSTTISERTHGEIWELALDGEEIPLYAMFAERLGQITQTHINDAFSR